MKKEKNLTKILYVFVVLSLVYTGYTLFSTYSALSTYIAAGTITTAQIIKEEKKEAPEQKVEEDETDTIESKEIVDKTNEDQAEK